MKSYKELQVWQKGYKLCLDIYRITKHFPKEEQYGLTAQMRISAVSIPSNIAEGYGRKSRKEYIQLLYVAYGSMCELETQLSISKDLGYIDTKNAVSVQQGIGDVERMLKTLIKSLEAKP
ncbi:MAG: four helix bundle protein [Proteobacteria bacterium]|nr:four helix bundle protein [Pseudomonadota bacterium]